MPNQTSKSRIDTIRLSNETIAKIEKALATQSNPNTSISDYCKTVVTRWAFRHDKKH